MCATTLERKSLPYSYKYRSPHEDNSHESHKIQLSLSLLRVHVDVGLYESEMATTCIYRTQNQKKTIIVGTHKVNITLMGIRGSNFTIICIACLIVTVRSLIHCYVVYTKEW